MHLHNQFVFIFLALVACLRERVCVFVRRLHTNRLHIRAASLSAAFFIVYVLSESMNDCKYNKLCFMKL